MWHSGKGHAFNMATMRLNTINQLCNMSSNWLNVTTQMFNIDAMWINAITQIKHKILVS